MTLLVSLSVLALYGLYSGAKKLGKRLRKIREEQEKAQKLIDEYARRNDIK